MQAHIQTLIDDFALFEDWEERYAYLIDLGKHLPHMPEAQKIAENKIVGCTSQVWLIKHTQDDKLYFTADSDAHIVRGLIALLHKIYNDQSLEIVKNIDIEAAFDALGLSTHLSPNRRNGFFAMVEKLSAV